MAALTQSVEFATTQIKNNNERVIDHLKTLYTTPHEKLQSFRTSANRVAPGYLNQGYIINDQTKFAIEKCRAQNLEAIESVVKAALNDIQTRYQETTAFISRHVELDPTNQHLGLYFVQQYIRELTILSQQDTTIQWKHLYEITKQAQESHRTKTDENWRMLPLEQQYKISGPVLYYPMLFSAMRQECEENKVQYDQGVIYLQHCSLGAFELQKPRPGHEAVFQQAKQVVRAEREARNLQNTHLQNVQTQQTLPTQLGLQLQQVLQFEPGQNQWGQVGMQAPMTYQQNYMGANSTHSFAGSTFGSGYNEMDWQTGAQFPTGNNFGPQLQQQPQQPSPSSGDYYSFNQQQGAGYQGGSAL
ncbi:hypothetical protein B0J11DRAFT_589425 [Dendryphion nanum]|uniref:Uncharacterized protein n=1 Tax=Dendryphion nanum TaxID=256645 RepID=A0A9P9EM77_9PLEO|nr:hypothetical protein B0J11DRAFT_589425 [Dendryphion nanum]